MTHEDTPKHVDLLVVGAGISGIGAAYYLQKYCPEKSFVILENRESFGGTWDLFRYPGIRSDSDMFTLGYAFKPWTEQKAIADGPSILQYLDETATQYDIHEKIHYRHNVNFLYMCSGYYNYEAGYTPDWQGMSDYAGTIIHPQNWPQDLDYEGKEILVIGSGATAVTLVPAMLDSDTPAKHVTMLQRSPTYMVSRPGTDAFANRLRKLLPAKLAYLAIRWRNVLMQKFTFSRARNRPEKVKNALLRMVRNELGPDYDVETHFTPSYNPWEQRLCLVPDSDFFNAVRENRATVVTDHIDRFTKKGLKLKSGNELEADLIITATGLDLQVAGGIKVTVDGQPINFHDTITYKSMMFSDVPNFAISFGYTNASWTLRADLTNEYICRLLNHMRDTGSQIATPRLPTDEVIKREPWVDFSSGYFQRAKHKLPAQGHKGVWRNLQNYTKDIRALKYGAIDDGAIEFRRRDPATPATGASEEPIAIAAE